jgi:hypothetical protein
MLLAPNQMTKTHHHSLIYLPSLCFYQHSITRQVQGDRPWILPGKSTDFKIRIHPNTMNPVWHSPNNPRNLLSPVTFRHKTHPYMCTHIKGCFSQKHGLQRVQFASCPCMWIMWFILIGIFLTYGNLHNHTHAWCTLTSWWTIYNRIYGTNSKYSKKQALLKM